MVCTVNMATFQTTSAVNSGFFWNVFLLSFFFGGGYLFLQTWARFHTDKSFKKNTFEDRLKTHTHFYIFW